MQIKKFDRKKPKLSDNQILPRVKFKGEELNDHQVKVLELVAEGFSNEEIAERLHFSAYSVSRHLRSTKQLIANALGCDITDRQLVVFAMDMLDGYLAFLKLQEEKQIERSIKKYWLKDSLIPVTRYGDIELIEDWESTKAVFLSKQQVYEITDFESSLELIYKNKKYLVV